MTETAPGGAPGGVPPADERLIEAAAELRVLSGRLARRLRAATADAAGITLSQASVMNQLDRNGPATIVALARAEMVRPQSMGATLAALEQAGLVERDPRPADRRQVVMSLTREGRRHLDAGRRGKEGWLLDAIRTNLDDREQTTLIEAIGLLDRIVGEEPRT